MIYLDYNATTPVHPNVLEEMFPFSRELFANSGSRTHEPGRLVEKIISQSRSNLASYFNLEPNNVIFTSGATEANNIVILGLKKYLKDSGKSKIITSSFEHKSVLEPIRYLESEEAIEVKYIDPQPNGKVTLEEFKEAIDEKTGLVSLMHVNNELGTVQPVHEIANYAKSKGALVHVDGAQGFCKTNIKLSNLIDYYTVSAHKIYGPKGVGCLFINGRKAKKPLSPVYYGGGQELGLRPGTLPTPLIVGLSKAADVCKKLYSDKNKKELATQINGIYEGLKSIPHLHVNTEIDTELCTTLNFRIDGIKSEALLLRLKELALSNGSACSSTDYKPSHVLKAIGLSDKEALESIRLTISPYKSVSPNSIINEFKKII